MSISGCSQLSESFDIYLSIWVCSFYLFIYLSNNNNNNNALSFSLFSTLFNRVIRSKSKLNEIPSCLSLEWWCQKLELKLKPNSSPDEKSIEVAIITFSYLPITICSYLSPFISVEFTLVCSFYLYVYLLIIMLNSLSLLLCLLNFFLTGWLEVRVEGVKLPLTYLYIWNVFPTKIKLNIKDQHSVLVHLF